MYWWYKSLKGVFLQYVVITSFFPLSIFCCCLLIHLTPSLFQLCSSQMIIDILYGNLPSIFDILDADAFLLR